MINFHKIRYRHWGMVSKKVKGCLLSLQRVKSKRPGKSIDLAVVLLWSWSLMICVIVLILETPEQSCLLKEEKNYFCCRLIINQQMKLKWKELCKMEDGFTKIHKSYLTMKMNQIKIIKSFMDLIASFQDVCQFQEQ